jgi:hypothetical protein
MFAFRLSPCALPLAAVLCAGSVCAQPAPPASPPEVEPRPQSTPEQQRERWLALPPEERMRAWNSLPPEQRWQMWHSLPPEERMRIRESLTPEQREAWRRRWQDQREQMLRQGGPHDSPPYRQLTPAERQRMRDQIREAQGVSSPRPPGPPPAAAPPPR